MNDDLRSLPSSWDAEKGFLSCLLQSPDPGETGLWMVKPEAFYVPAHRQIFCVLNELYENGTPPDALNLQQALIDRSLLDAVGGPSTIAEIFTYVPTSANAGFYADIVRRKALFRGIIDVATKAIEKAYADQEEDPTEHIALLEQSLQGLDPASPKARGPEHVSRPLSETMQQLFDRHENPGQSPGIPTGIKPLDAILPGFVPGHHFIFAARPGTGKTSFATNAIANICRSAEPVHTLFISMEMAASEITDRMVSLVAGLDSVRMTRGELSPDEQSAAAKAAAMIEKWPVHIDGRERLTLSQIRSAVRNSVRAHCTKVVFLDYLQLVRAPRYGRDTGNHAQELKETADGLKSIAKEFGITMVSLVQIKRKDGKSKSGPAPTIDELKGSGGIEESADIVAMFYRPDMGDDAPAYEEAEIIVGKHRGGPLGKAEVEFVGAMMQICERKCRFVPGDSADGEEELIDF